MLITLFFAVFIANCSHRKIPAADADKILQRITELGNAQGKSCIDSFRVEEFHRSAAKAYGYSHSEWANFVSNDGKEQFSRSIESCIYTTKLPEKKKKKKKKKK